MEQFCNDQYAGPMPYDAQVVLSQIAKGIIYLHTKGFAHGNLNPQTVLISQSQAVRIKVAILIFVQISAGFFRLLELRFHRFRFRFLDRPDN